MNDNTIGEILKKHLLDNYVKGKGFASSHGREIDETEAEWLVEEYVSEVLCKSMDDFMRNGDYTDVYEKEEAE